MLNTVVAFILVRFGLSAAQAAVWAPKVITLVQALAGFAKALKTSGALDAARDDVKQALRGIHPHLLPTPEEEAREMERRSDIGTGGG